MQRTLERFIRLQTDNFLQRLVDIASIVSGNGGGDIGIKINRRVGGVLYANAGHHFFPQRGCRRRRLCEERFIPGIWRIVVLNKITDINFFFPVRTVKSVPCFGVQHIAGIDIYLHEK